MNSIVFDNILSNLWTFVPLLIIIIILKILIENFKNKTKKENYRKFMKENKLKGIEYEKRVGKYYEEKGYKVEYNGIIKDRKDDGIDLICKKDNEVKILIQCKNYNKEESINHDMIKIFHSNATRYMDLNNLDRNEIKLKYIVPDVKVFEKSAINIFRDKYYKCRYEIVE